MPDYNPDDVQALARYILAGATEAMDNSGSRTRQGLWYCTCCGVYEEYPYNEPINHKHTCIVKIAQDVLTNA